MDLLCHVLSSHGLSSLHLSCTILLYHMTVMYGYKDHFLENLAPHRTAVASSRSRSKGGELAQW